jgi:hypothetical protein
MKIITHYSDEKLRLREGMSCIPSWVKQDLNLRSPPVTPASVVPTSQSFEQMKYSLLLSGLNLDLAFKQTS